MQVWACSGGFVFAGIRVYSLPQMAGEAVRAALMFCFEESVLCARRRNPLLSVGPDAPTPARGHGLQPYGALTLFFRWRKKSVQKKASGTALRKKGSYCPF